MKHTTVSPWQPTALHVFKSDGGWRLVRQGEGHASVYRTQADAVKNGARIARAEQGVLLIYDQYGALQSTRRYNARSGRDPYRAGGASGR
jgi:hypothetical protein